MADDAALERQVSYRTFDGSPSELPLHVLLRHLINHATYHRGQLSTMLRQLGQAPPSTDLVKYCRDDRASRG